MIFHLKYTPLESILEHHHHCFLSYVLMVMAINTLLYNMVQVDLENLNLLFLIFSSILISSINRDAL